MRADGIHTPFTSTGERTAVRVEVQVQIWSFCHSDRESGPSVLVREDLIETEPLTVNTNIQDKVALQNDLPFEPEKSH